MAYSYRQRNLGNVNVEQIAGLITKNKTAHGNLGKMGERLITYRVKKQGNLHGLRTIQSGSS